MEQVWKNGPHDGYKWFEQMKTCYDSMVDDLSQEVFWARLHYDLCPTIENQKKLLNSATIDGKAEILSIYSQLGELSRTQIPIYLYGAGCRGLWWYRYFMKMHIRVVAFIDRKCETLSTYCGIPVIAPPKNKTDLPEDCLIFITTKDYQTEIYQSLLLTDIPAEKIIRINEAEKTLQHQYFDFPQYYTAGGAFIDGGCLDLSTSQYFSKWSNGQYSKIYAFEPDPKSYQRCLTKAKEENLRDLHIIQAGLGKETGIASFDATNNGSSHISNQGTQTIQIATIDETVGNEKVSFIKMDIEGAELDALMGAANTIQRDKPLCAICVYHKLGDVLVIMNYLKSLVPEYRFALRHYSSAWNETVLYAFE